MPALLELDPNAGDDPLGVAPGGLRERTRETDRRAARIELRRQIARMERELGELFATTFPRLGIEWSIGAAGGPRVLGIAELESTRDALADRLADARAEIARRADHEQANRELVERMIADPADYRWVRVRNEDVGEPGCKHWHSRPKWGIIGMFLGWWRVKLSSGCPLATGPRRRRRPPRSRHRGHGFQVLEEAAKEAAASLSPHLPGWRGRAAARRGGDGGGAARPNSSRLCRPPEAGGHPRRLPRR